MNYNWINPKEIIDIEADSLVLFGAGAGSEEFLSYLEQSGINASVKAVTDNDPSYWGKELYHYPIIPPRSLDTIRFDKIVVTSISGREAIARQLEDWGYEKDKTYLLVGKYPKSYDKNFKTLLEDIGQRPVLKNAHCLHIGPGGFLGLEVMLYSFGVEKIHSIDKLPFNIHYPDISILEDEYQAIGVTISDMILDGADRKRAHERYQKLFIRENGQLLINTKKIKYNQPMDMCQILFPDQTFDAVFSFSVLEHVTDPDSAIHEVSRVLKPGGLSYHIITTQDHRGFSKIGSFNPFSFRSYSSDRWEQIADQRFYQNRLLPIEWKCLHDEHHLNVLKYKVECRHEITDEAKSNYHPDFLKFSNMELGEAGCRLLSRKA